MKIFKEFLRKIVKTPWPEPGSIIYLSRDLPPHSDPEIRAQEKRLNTLWENYYKNWPKFAPENTSTIRLQYPEDVYSGWLPEYKRLRDQEEHYGKTIIGLEQWYHPKTNEPKWGMVWMLVKNTQTAQS